MNITITENAIKVLSEKIGGQKGYVKIQNEMVGGTCGAGVPTLTFVSSIDESDDVLFETNNGPILMEKSQLIYFDEDLIIDFSEAANSFQLKSPQQIVNGRMAFVSKSK